MVCICIFLYLCASIFLSVSLYIYVTSNTYYARSRGVPRVVEGTMHYDEVRAYYMYTELGNNDALGRASDCLWQSTPLLNDDNRAGKESGGGRGWRFSLPNG